MTKLPWYYKCGNCSKRLDCKNNDNRAKDPNVGEVLSCDMFVMDRGMYGDTMWVRTDELCKSCKLDSIHRPILEEMKRKGEELPCGCYMYEPKWETKHE